MSYILSYLYIKHNIIVVRDKRADIPNPIVIALSFRFIFPCIDEITCMQKNNAKVTIDTPSAVWDEKIVIGCAPTAITLINIEIPNKNLIVFFRFIRQSPLLFNFL